MRVYGFGELTNDDFQVFVGGQIEIINRGRNPRRGEIKSISIEPHDELHIKFAWMAENLGEITNPLDEEWVEIKPEDYEISMECFRFTDLEPVTKTPTRLMLDSPFTSQVTYLHLSNDPEALDRKVVRAA